MFTDPVLIACQWIYLADLVSYQNVIEMTKFNPDHVKKHWSKQLLRIQSHCTLKGPIILEIPFRRKQLLEYSKVWCWKTSNNQLVPMSFSTPVRNTYLEAQVKTQKSINITLHICALYSYVAMTYVLASSYFGTSTPSVLWFIKMLTDDKLNFNPVQL